MTVPTLTVVGRAEREVVPDRVVVSVEVRTPVLPSSQEALGRCAEARRRLLDDLRGAHPASAIADGRITTQAQQRRVTIEDELDGHSEERWQEAVRDALDRADGLASAAGMAVGPVLAIGEPDPSPTARYEEVAYGARLMSADELQAELGELRPEPETRGDRVTVRVALVAAERA